MSGFLKKAFGTAAAAGFLAAGTVAALADSPPSSSVGRPLTDGEREMASIFGKAADFSIVSLHAGPHVESSGSITIGQTYDSRTIAFFGHPYLSLDYSKETDPTNVGAMFHESTHIWQFQTGFTFTSGHCQGGYHYALTEGRKLEDFCDEAQGAIVEDYSRRYLVPAGAAPSHWYVEMCGYDTPQHDALLLKMVEERFPGARKLRLKLGHGENADGARERPADAPACPNTNRPDPNRPAPFVPRKGQPVFFCETLANTFKRINGIAFKADYIAWPGFKAELSRKDPVCTVSIWDTDIATLGGDHFNPNGTIKDQSMAQLAGELAKYTPGGVVASVRDGLSDLFADLVEQQKAERNALKQINSVADAKRVLKRLEDQLANDPSLPDSSRGFVEEKAQIVRDIIDQLEHGKDPVVPPPVAQPGDEARKPAAHTPRGGKGPGVKGPRRGGNGGSVSKPAAPGQPAEPAHRQPRDLSADKNIKNVLGSAFGGRSP